VTFPLRPSTCGPAERAFLKVETIVARGPNVRTLAGWCGPPAVPALCCAVSRLPLPLVASCPFTAFRGSLLQTSTHSLRIRLRATATSDALSNFVWPSRCVASTSAVIDHSTSSGGVHSLLCYIARIGCFDGETFQIRSDINNGLTYPPSHPRQCSASRKPFLSREPFLPRQSNFAAQALKCGIIQAAAAL
jgi:hypothetical protein